MQQRQQHSSVFLVHGRIWVRGAAIKYTLPPVYQAKFEAVIRRLLPSQNKALYGSSDFVRLAESSSKFYFFKSKQSYK